MFTDQTVERGGDFVTDRAMEQELKELHEDINVVNENAPEMMPILIGVVKGLRIATEATNPQPPKQTA